MTGSGGPLAVRRSAHGVVVWIQAHPRSRRPSVGGVQGDALRVAVREPASEGRANAACARALASALGVPARAVSIDPGSRHRRKRVQIEGDPDALAARLALLAGGPDMG